MAGIYIHIPFCKQACFYCNFHFSTSLKDRDRMVADLLKEIGWRTQKEKEPLCGMTLPEKSQIETVYFGGGTPSILAAEEIDSLLRSIYKHYNVSQDAEITLEANPDDISEDKLKMWRSTGINRLSIGIQSFFDRDLKWMNRGHDSKQAERSLLMARDAGFHNFSADLIFGIPGLSDQDWEFNMKKLIDLKVPHISSYALTVEPKTALKRMIELKKKENVNDAGQARQFKMLMHTMRKAGYEHYEISNFALPDFRSKHNSSYWQQKPYLGIGPSAHSFDGNHRYWNMANNPLYMKAMEDETPIFQMETLTETMRLNEYIMTSLRTVEGMDFDYVTKKFSPEFNFTIREKLNKLSANWFSERKDKVVLSEEGILFTDKISAELFF
ncbi:MAG: radical SAM family heme chaperone HemW [Chitinophagaceae bacterium]|nr:radical SAM family heme chaperone HemW [Chitinophagaceae bacterium]